MPKVIIEGDVSINYVEAGEGEKTIVLIHGWTANHERWSRIMEFLSKYFKVIALDLRGHGESSKPEMEYSIDLYTDDLYKFLKELGIEKAILAGHSMGGMISQNFYIKHSEMVEGLILIGTSAKVVDNFSMKFNTSLAMFLMKVNYNMAIKTVLGRAFSNLTPKDVKEKYINEALEKIPKYVAISSFKDFVKNFDTRGKLKDLKVPTLIIVGENDRMLPPRMSQLLNNSIPDSELYVVPEAGHEVMIESPDEVIKAIDTFLIKFKE